MQQTQKDKQFYLLTHDIDTFVSNRQNVVSMIYHNQNYKKLGAQYI